MARIRTIKPEFPHSESMGSISRDARLTFILLWTIADDSGRLRGNSRMLASLLFPYDDDVPKMIDGWLSELEVQKCVLRYEAEGANYLQILNWTQHQKVDKPSQSKIPVARDDSRSLDNIREASSGDLRTKDQGPKDQGSKKSKPKNNSRSREMALADWEARNGFLLPSDFAGFMELSDQEIGTLLEFFKSKCRAKDYRYVDFKDAFRSWRWGDQINEITGRNTRKNNAGSLTKYEQTAAGAIDAVSRFIAKTSGAGGAHDYGDYASAEAIEGRPPRGGGAFQPASESG